MMAKRFSQKIERAVNVGRHFLLYVKICISFIFTIYLLCENAINSNNVVELSVHVTPQETLLDLFTWIIEMRMKTNKILILWNHIKSIVLAKRKRIYRSPRAQRYQSAAFDWPLYLKLMSFFFVCVTGWEQRFLIFWFFRRKEVNEEVNGTST